MGRSLNPTTFKAGGGLFDDVDATIKKVRYSADAPEGYTAQNGNPIFANLTILIDGAEDEVTQSISLGGKSGDNFTVINDGEGLEPQNDDAGISDKSKWAMLIASLVNEGFPGDRLESEDFTPVPMEGCRVHFNRVPTGFSATFGQKRKGKDGKEYEDTALVVTKLHSLPEEATATGKKAAGKATATKGGAAAQKKAAESDLEDQARTALIDILAAKDAPIKRQDITLLANKALMKDTNRTALVKLMFSEEFLSSADGVTYDKRKGTVALA